LIHDLPPKEDLITRNKILTAQLVASLIGGQTDIILEIQAVKLRLGLKFNNSEAAPRTNRPIIIQKLEYRIIPKLGCQQTSHHTGLH
jgi:hypothetical protein